MTVLTFHTIMRKIRELLSKSGFSHLGKVQTHLEENWGWFLNDKFVLTWQENIHVNTRES